MLIGNLGEFFSKGVDDNIYNRFILCYSMKLAIVSLFVFMMMFSFVVAEGSSIQVDFYIQDEGMTGGYEEDAVDTGDSLQSRWLKNFIYCAMIIVAIGILIKILQKIGGSFKPKTFRKKAKSKGKRRKKK